MEGPERNIQTAKQYAVHTTLHVKNVIRSLHSKETIFPKKNGISIKCSYWDTTC
jgi:hypothetical protein